MASPFPTYDPAASYDVQVEDIEYRREGDEAWLARLYRPQGTGPFPALLDVHGGAWNRGDRLNDAKLNQALAGSGVVVAAIDFRMPPKYPYPASIADINYGTRWLKAHARAFNADPNTVGALGVSSGGHIIMLSAMRPHDPRYAALPLPEASDVDATLAYAIVCWGVLDPYGRYLMAQERGNTELVAHHDRYFGTLEAMREGNPLLILERREPVGLPPTLVIQGTADDGLPKGMTENFVALYSAAGGSIELELVPDMPHGLAGWPEPEVAHMIDRMKRFIADRLAAPVAPS